MAIICDYGTLDRSLNLPQNSSSDWLEKENKDYFQMVPLQMFQLMSVKIVL